jgi:hypothetical protein
MKKIVLFLGFMLCMVSTYSQNGDGALVLKRNKVIQNDKVLKGPELRSILSSNPASAEAFKTCKQNATIGSSLMLAGAVFECAGAALLLSETIKEAKEVDKGNLGYETHYGASLALAGLGLVSVAVGIPFNIKARKALMQSINDYNGSLKSSRYQPVEFKVLLSCNKVGLVMRF